MAKVGTPLEQAASHWWLAVLAGLVFIAAGILALAYQGITLLALGLVFGISILVWGVSALVAAFDSLSCMRNMPAVRTVRHFHDHAGYINALAQNVRDYWMKSGRPDRLVMSFHGVPRVTLDKGDPYHCECQKTGRLLAEALALKPWLKPYTAEVLTRLGKQKVARVDVICPGFVSDCLETLEEIAIEGKTTFIQAGGREFNFIPCLNERNEWMQALTDIVLTHLLGWTVEPSTEELDNSRLRAMAMGAKS